MTANQISSNRNAMNKEYQHILQNIQQIESKIQKSKSSSATFIGTLVILPSFFILLMIMRFLPLPFPIILMMFIVLGIGIFATMSTASNIKKEEEKLKHYESLKMNHLNKTFQNATVQDSGNATHDGLLQMNIGNLERQYKETKNLAAKSLRFCLTQCLGGLLLIGVGAGLMSIEAIYYPIALILIGIGLILQLLAVFTFTQYNRSLRHLSHYQDSVVNLQNMLVALKLAETTKEEKTKKAIETKIMDYLTDKINWY